jgi:hypothetical protein
MAAGKYNMGDNKYRDGGITAIGIALITIGGVLMSNGNSESQGTQSLVWANSWFASGCASLLLGIAIIALSAWTLALRWKRSRWPRLPLANTRRSGLPAMPLLIKFVDEEWSPVREGICVFALRFTIINLTQTSINLTACILDSRASSQRLPAAGETLNAVSASIARMEREHHSDLLAGPVVVPGLKTASGWLVAWGTTPLSEPGRPACVFSAVDNCGNSYELSIDARPQRRYVMPLDRASSEQQHDEGGV